MTNQNNITWYLLMLVNYVGTGLTGCGHLVMYCTSHTLSGQQVLMQRGLSSCSICNGCLVFQSLSLAFHHVGYCQHLQLWKLFWLDTLFVTSDVMASWPIIRHFKPVSSIVPLLKFPNSLPALTNGVHIVVHMVRWLAEAKSPVLIYQL